MSLLLILVQAVNVVALPLLLVGVIRKVKAGMQNRVGAPLLQPFYDAAKLLRKGETVSETASQVFRLAPLAGLAIALVLAAVVPWAGIALTARGTHLADLLLVVYLLGLAKFLAMLAALDTGSAFGGLGASREATISVLAEPVLVLGLATLSLGAGTTDLGVVYSSPVSPFVAALVGIALVVVALAELSRMPVDDPSTHLELTMVHEAMILENSGRNLALTELAVALRTCLFLGLAVQTLLRAWSGYAPLPPLAQWAIGVPALLAAAAVLAVVEAVLVKLHWRRVPGFLAFGTALSLVAALVAAARG